MKYFTVLFAFFAVIVLFDVTEAGFWKEVKKAAKKVEKTVSKAMKDVEKVVNKVEISGNQHGVNDAKVSGKHGSVSYQGVKKGVEWVQQNL